MRIARTGEREEWRWKTESRLDTGQNNRSLTLAVLSAANNSFLRSSLRSQYINDTVWLQGIMAERDNVVFRSKFGSLVKDGIKICLWGNIRRKMRASGIVYALCIDCKGKRKAKERGLTGCTRTETQRGSSHGAFRIVVGRCGRAIKRVEAGDVDIFGDFVVNAQGFEYARCRLDGVLLP